jgi:hypothetical protein
MSLRCGCYREGDATVFGDVHECSKAPDTPKPTKAQTSFGTFIPSWRFVVPETSGGVYDPDLQEARIHQRLSPDELEE